jgi:DNA-binding MarR family transcriptional regulator
LITREPAETDRRQRHVKLTAKGQKLIEELASVHHKELRNRSGEMIQALKRLRK